MLEFLTLCSGHLVLSVFENRFLRRISGTRRDGNVRMDLKKWGSYRKNWIDPSQDRDY